MDTQDRRAEERSHLLRFLDVLQDPPQGQREFGDRPDLIIHAATRRIGIEHTQLIRSHDSFGRPHPKAAESLEDRCLDRAREIFESQGGRTLYVHANFSGPVMRKRDVDGVAERLAAAVHEIIITMDLASQRPIESWSFNRRAVNPLPEQIEYIWVDEAHGERLWGVTRGDAILELDEDLIQAAIDGKNAKVSDYRQRCDELWLLLVSDGFSPATELRLPDAIGEMVFRTDFDRVFYFNNFSLSLAELVTERAHRDEAAPGH